MQREPKAIILFGHGAGAGPESEFMQTIGHALTERGFVVVFHVFPYWQKVLQTGKKRPPDRADKLDESFIAAAQQLKDEYPVTPLLVMGKSMGARVAFRCAQEVGAAARIGLGFPFHPPGKKDKHRMNEIEALQMSSLIVQGERDPFGNVDAVQEFASQYSSLNNIEISWVPAGNHDLKQPKRIDDLARTNWADIVTNIEKWWESVQ